MYLVLKLSIISIKITIFYLSEKKKKCRKMLYVLASWLYIFSIEIEQFLLVINSTIPKKD